MGIIISHIFAKLSLKKAGIKSSKIGWFFLIELLLTVIVTRFFEKAFEFGVHLAKGTWSPGLMFEGIAGILAIIGAIFVGLILLLTYVGKIKFDDIKLDKGNNNFLQQIEILSNRCLDIDLLIHRAKDEINIIYSFEPNFICKYIDNIDNHKNNQYNIKSVKILIQNPVYYSNISSISTSITKKSENETNMYFYNDNNQCIESLVKLKKVLQYKGVNNIDVKMIDFPIAISAIMIDPTDKWSNDHHSEMYVEPLFFQK